VGDTVEGIRIVIESGEVSGSAKSWQAGGGIFNIGRDDNETTMLEVAQMACGIAGASEDLIVEVEPPSAQTVVKRLGTGKLRSLGWRPTVELQEGMERMFEMVRTMPAPETVRS
jgi:nucleoside-diphosphate-sugar epimerase